MDAEDAEEFTQALGQIVGGSWRQIHWAKKQGIPAALGLTVEQWVHDRLGGYVRLTIEDRRQAVSELSAQGESTRAIAAVLGCTHTSVRRDLGGTNVPGDPTRSPVTGDGAGTNVPAEPPAPPDDDVDSDANASAGSTCPSVTDEDAGTNVSVDQTRPPVTDSKGRAPADRPSSPFARLEQLEIQRQKRVALARCLADVRLLPRTLINESSIKYVAAFLNEFPEDFEHETRMTPAEFIEILEGIAPTVEALKQRMMEDRQDESEKLEDMGARRSIRSLRN